MHKFLKKIIFTIFICSLIFIVPPTTVRANDKTSTINLPQAYNSITITVSLENPGNYSAVLVSPKEESYDFVVIDEYTLTCTVGDAKEGDWNVVITNENGEVPKATIKLERSKANESEAVDSNNITVGKDIVGLKIYFKDDNVVIEWTDESVPRISLQIVDLDTNEAIANTNAEDNYFECPIPESTKNISVNIVPASSSSVSGATTSYTYAVDNHPDATVEFPEDDYVNEDSVTATVKSNGSYGIYVEVNGEKTLEEKSIPSGDSKYEIPLGADGNVEIKFYFVDENGNMRSTTKKYVKDTVAPELSFEEEYDGLQTYDDTIIINGKVINFESITINGNEIETTSDGTFAHSLTLHVGENDFVVNATDNAGNVTEYNISITMLESTGLSREQIGTIAFVLLVAAIALVVLLKKKKKAKSTLVSDNGIDHKDVNEENGGNVSDNQLTKGKKVKIKKNNTKLKKKSPKQNKETIFDRKFIIACVTVVIFVAILVNFMIEISKASSGSMSPTIRTGDVVIYNRLAYKVRDVKRGDSISFKHDNSVYGKRVIGIAGDTISFHNGYVYINDKKIDESAYIGEDIETNCTEKFTVPDGCVFVLGDNREDSNDSRFWDAPYVDKKDIIGKQLININAIFR